MNDPNNGKLKPASEFKRMLIREISWKGIKEILTSNKGYLSAFQRGGYDFDKKNRGRAEEILIKKVNDKDEKLIFVQWYREQEQYHEILDSIVLSDDFQGSSGEAAPERAKLLISEEKFSSLTRILNKDHAKLFLHFCQAEFSEKQREVLLAISETGGAAGEDRSGSSVIPSAYLETIEKLKGQLQELTNSERKLARNQKKSQTAIDQYKVEIAELKKKNATQESILQKYRIGMDDRIDKAKKEISEELEKYREDLAKALEAKDDYKAKYDRTVQQLDVKIRENAELERQINEARDSSNLRFQKILDRVDLRQLTLSLNEPDEVREKLNSVVRPHTVDDSILKEKTGDELRRQWDIMIKKEVDMMEKICRMDICEINDKYYQNWSSHTDDFNDLIYSLRARAVLVKMIHEILWQNMHPIK